MFAQEEEKDEDKDNEDEDTTWRADGVDDEEEEEVDAPDQERIESHSKAGPHSRLTGAAGDPRVSTAAWGESTH